MATNGTETNQGFDMLIQLFLLVARWFNDKWGMSSKLLLIAVPKIRGTACNDLLKFCMSSFALHLCLFPILDCKDHLICFFTKLYFVIKGCLQLIFHGSGIICKFICHHCCLSFLMTEKYLVITEEKSQYRYLYYFLIYEAIHWANLPPLSGINFIQVQSSWGFVFLVFFLASILASKAQIMLWTPYVCSLFTQYPLVPLFPFQKQLTLYLVQIIFTVVF